MKTEVLYGVHSVQESIKAGRRTFFEVYVKKDKLSERLESILSDAGRMRIPIRKVDSAVLKKNTGTDMHQGIAAAVSPYPIVGIDDLMSGSRDEMGHRFFLMLDSIMDPQNMGALMRTAVCAGVHGIIVPKDRSAGLTPTVSRASAGALEHCLVSRVTNLSTTIKELKKEGIWVGGMDRDAAQSVFDTDLTIPVALVIGGEGKGIRPLVKTSCDFLMSIPQTGVIDSLNAAAAGSVVMVEVFRQRHVKKVNSE